MRGGGRRSRTIVWEEEDEEEACQTFPFSHSAQADEGGRRKSWQKGSTEEEEEIYKKRREEGRLWPQLSGSTSSTFPPSPFPWLRFIGSLIEDPKSPRPSKDP